ncbi:hypothetical protein M3Y97_00748500 [Aphelenchoides bicaudatus]|nr:hypothetical protein M3Y97_00748500 [Aphelenchoides bicaudatus]
MYPTAYTLTVLVLTLLQYSFDKRYTACQNGTLQDGNSTIICHYNVSRKEIRQLSRQEFEGFVQVFNEYSTRNDTDELNANINELGVVQIFDELLQPKKMLTPYWEYRIDLNLEDPESNALWSAQQFQTVNQASDAQWLTEFIENENSADDDEFFGDDPFSKLWKRRRAALKLIRKLKKTDVFWHLLLLVSIEIHINRTFCVRDFGKFTRWINESCQVTLRDGEICKTSGDCYSRRCSKNYCASTRRPPIVSTIFSPEISNEVKTPVIESTTQKPIINTPPTTKILSNFEKTNELESTEMPKTTPSTTSKSTNLIVESAEPTNMLFSSGQEALTPTEKEVATAQLISTTQKSIESNTSNAKMSNEVLLASTESSLFVASSKAPEFQPKYLFKLDPPSNQQNEPTKLAPNNTQERAKTEEKMAVTTEFLANELSTPYPEFNFGQQTNEDKLVKKGRRKGKKRKNKKKLTTAMPEVHDQIPATEAYAEPTFSTFENFTEENNQIEQENYGTDTLDALLPYLPTPKVPTMINWSSKMPLRMAYFGFTIIEGSLGKQRRLKEKGHKRAKGARIYVRGLGMPSSYTQVTQVSNFKSNTCSKSIQGKQMKNGIGALGRTLNPNDNEPFVEFKMRVENRYGTPCKQMCLDSHQRYRRCARRTIRLSPYKKFSDPVPFFESENLALNNGLFTGKGYYRKRKLTYLLFKCD